MPKRVHACHCSLSTRAQFLPRFDANYKLRGELAKKNLYVRPAEVVEVPPVSTYEPFRKKQKRDENETNPPSTTLFVGNLSSDVDDKEVKRFFANFNVGGGGGEGC